VADPSDDELLREYREGDAGAFTTLFDRYSGPVYNFARYSLSEADGAEEVMQEAFMKVAQTAGNYEARGHFRTWLMRIVRNLCVDRIRAAGRRDPVVQVEDFAGLGAQSREKTPAEKAEEAERMHSLRRLLLKLPDGQREAIALYAFEQMTYRDIADVLDVPINTVKTLIRRARLQLVQVFE